jgi:hypothetical protein
MERSNAMSKDNTVSRSIVSAAPGWYVASLCSIIGEPGEDYCFTYDAIVAWQITCEGDPDHHCKVQILPITPSGMQSNDGEKDWCLKTPDGMYLLDKEHYDDEENKGWFDRQTESEVEALSFLRARQPTEEEMNKRMEEFRNSPTFAAFEAAAKETAGSTAKIMRELLRKSSEQ